MNSIADSECVVTPPGNNTLLSEGMVDLETQSINQQSKDHSIVKAVTLWLEAFKAPHSEKGQESISYLQKMGFITADKRLAASAIRSQASVEEAATSLLSRLAAREVSAEELSNTDHTHIKKLLPELSDSQGRVLAGIIRHQFQLEELDESSLISQFPFPVTQDNLFGQFLAGGCEDPRKAARHLRLAGPFFIRMKTLLEGLSQEKYKFISISTGREKRKEADEEEENEYDDIDIGGYSDPEFILQTIRAIIENAEALTGKDVPSIKAPMAYVPFPELPFIHLAHIRTKEHPQLAVELTDFLLNGNSEGGLINQRALSLNREKNHKMNKVRLTGFKARLKSHKKRKPDKNARASERKSHERRENYLRGKIDDLKWAIRDDNIDRRNSQTIVEEIRADEFCRRDLQEFRKKITAATEKGSHIVISFLEKDRFSLGAENNIIKLLDLAFTSRKIKNQPAIKKLRETSFIMKPQTHRCFYNSRDSGIAGIAEQIRTLKVEPSEMNSSIEFIAHGILAQKKTATAAQTMRVLRDNLTLPGIQKSYQFKYMVQQESGKKTPAVADYLIYAFEHEPAMSQTMLMQTLSQLRSIGVEEIPERCMEISRNRFHHPDNLLESYNRYCQGYRPDKLGNLPDGFDDLATFSRYREAGMESLGMEPESEQIEKYLEECGIVAVVDGTNYHPELTQSEEKDEEQTEEIWGNYVRPAERLIRTFTAKLMNGQVSKSLQNHSMIAASQSNDGDSMGFFELLFGVQIEITPDLSELNKVLADLTFHDQDTILTINAEAVEDLDHFHNLIKILRKNDIKMILRTREPFPGVPQVLVHPFMDDDISERLLDLTDTLQNRLELNQPPSEEVIKFTVQQIRQYRRPSDDPLNLTLQTLHGAAQSVRLNGFDTITDRDIVGALPAIFHVPDTDQIRQRVKAIDHFAIMAPLEVMGQIQAIENVADRMKSHILGLRDQTRPLSILLPGPTGVGKTELMLRFAQAANIPFFQVEGAQFSEGHTVSRLVGSPSGYVGEDKGILYKFLEKNSSGLIFIDEIEKMHPDVYTSLMNFFDKATLTAGNGESVSRPGMIIVGASNAGAEKLHRQMSVRDVKRVLAEAFVDRNGNKRPELVGRFEPIPMLAIEEDEFKNILKGAMSAIGQRPGFINANLELVEIDEAAFKLIYEQTREVCQFAEKGSNGFGFEKTVGGATESGLFHDMRHVHRALDQLAGKSIQGIAEEQYRIGADKIRNHPRKVIMTGDPENDRIELKDYKK